MFMHPGQTLVGAILLLSLAFGEGQAPESVTPAASAGLARSPCENTEAGFTTALSSSHAGQQSFCGTSGLP
jgi:hypothetical protein